ncbi:hypothetical protein ACFY71_10530 [Streptomyces cinerochromogenes]|uniref:hypothetical protein n=1 Tax=Streptomyces cinerochromogenes TaxID=66422 RepID=UPI0036B20412
MAALTHAMPPLRERERTTRALLSPRQPVFAHLQDLVAAEDVDALRTLRDAHTPLHRLLMPRAAAASCVRALVGKAPFLADEPAAVQALRASAAMGLALVGDAGRATDELTTGLLWLRHHHALPDHASAAAQPLLDGSAAGHATRLHRLLDAVPAADRDLVLPALTWLLALDGALPRTRPAAELTVLFDDGRGGVRGTLTAAVLPQGPPALLPDPHAMGGFRGDERFRQSLSDAWATSGADVTVTVLWSLTHADGVVGMVEDNSLGCAFAILLGEAARTTRRLRPPALRRINPRTALVGGLDAARPGVLVSVGGYQAKLQAVADGANVVVPAADREAALRAQLKGTADRLLFAATVTEAASKARVWDFPVVKRWGLAALTVLCAVVVLAVVVVQQVSADSEKESRKALAADLAARAMVLRQTDPRLAGLLALAGYTIEPDTPGAVQAMRDVLEANSGVRLSWRVSPAEVTSIAVDDRHGRVYTTGDDPYVKSWDLLTGKPLGKAAGAVTDLVLDHSSGLLAARDDQGVSVYSVLQPVPRRMGRLPAPTCAGTGSRPVATAFANSGVRLVEVRDDGTIAQYDTTTLRQTSCRRFRDIAPDDLITPVGTGTVRDATAGPGPPPELSGQPRAEDRALLLFTSGLVVAVGLDSHKVTVEIPFTDVQGAAAQITASDTTVYLATPRGVQAWDRRRHRQVAFPVGGLDYAPRSVAAQSGSVAIAGEDGTALVPVGTGDEATGGRDMETPRGGLAVTVAVGNRYTVVAGGRGGRVNVLDRRPGPLSLTPADQSTTVSFGPDGLLLLAAGDDHGSKGVFTIDPAAKPKIERNPVQRPYAHVEDYGSGTFDILDAARSRAYAVAAGQYQGQSVVSVWGKHDKTPRRALQAPQLDRGAADPGRRGFTATDFVPGTDLLVARHATGPLALWSTTTFRLVATVDLHAGTGLAVSGTRALALEDGGKDGPRIALTDLATRTTRRVDAPGAAQVAWSRDGSRVAVLGADGFVRFLDADLKETGESLTLPETTTAPKATALSPDGGHLAVAVGDQVLVYDTTTGQQALPTLRSSGGTDITRLDWSPNGDFLAGATRPVTDSEVAGPVNLWQVADIDWKRQICRWTGNAGLTTREWRAQVGGRHAYIDLCAGRK